MTLAVIRIEIRRGRLAIRKCLPPREKVPKNELIAMTFSSTTMLYNGVYLKLLNNDGRLGIEPVPSLIRKNPFQLRGGKIPCSAIQKLSVR